MHGLLKPLTSQQITDILEDLLALILSSRRDLRETIAQLATQPRTQQEWVLEWTKTLAFNNLEMAYHFVINIPPALNQIETPELEEWLTETLSAYDKSGLPAAIQQLETITHLKTRTQQKGLPLREINNILQHFIAGLDGRILKISESETAFTDTETLFLPPHLNVFPEKTDNFNLYKRIAVHLWAQIWFGTWRLSLHTVADTYPDPHKAIQQFHTLERLRLDACIAREFAGLQRTTTHLLTQLGQTPIPPNWAEIAASLAQPSATVEDSYAWLPTVYELPLTTPVCYQGILCPDIVDKIMNQRILREKREFQTELTQIRQLKPDKTNTSPETKPQQILTNQDHQQPIPLQNIFLPQGESQHFPPTLQRIITSIIQDTGGIPAEYWIDPNYDEPMQKKENPTLTLKNQKPTDEQNTFLYPEWDYQRQRYYKNWCTLREIPVTPEQDDFVKKTLHHYRNLLKNLHRTFEALRGGDKRLRYQPNGDDIDIEAVVRAWTDYCNGFEMDSNIYTRLQKVTRSIAVMFMVDMSGSTKGWINQAERESLVLLCEVLKNLQDEYAIYGFSGITRKKCEIYPIKTFQENYTQQVQQRISGIKPQSYTRMGVAVRHLTHLLNQTEANIKLLITLSDGKPDDEGDNYRGKYGIEDTRQALIEAKRSGIHPFCITIDSEAKTYLPHLYGSVNYVIIDKVAQLPQKVADIYRKLTS